MRVLKTKYLFRSLVSLLKPEVIFDIGSLNGNDALHFETLAPGARVFAFEANPNNYAVLKQSAQRKSSRIVSVNCAVGDRDGTAEFVVLDQPASADDVNPGMHSTRSRVTAISAPQRKLTVPICRLDSFAHEHGLAGPMALWIDVEGGSHEVLTGALGIKDQIAFAHVEVETKPVWENQKLEKDCIALADTMGFDVVARGSHPLQRDLVLIARTLPEGTERKLVDLALAGCERHGPLTAIICRATSRIRGSR